MDQIAGSLVMSVSLEPGQPDEADPLGGDVVRLHHLGHEFAQRDARCCNRRTMALPTMPLRPAT